MSRGNVSRGVTIGFQASNERNFIFTEFLTLPHLLHTLLLLTIFSNVVMFFTVIVPLLNVLMMMMMVMMRHGWLRGAVVSSLLFHAGQAAIKLPSAEASKRAQCTSPGQYTPYIKGIMKTP